MPVNHKKLKVLVLFDTAGTPPEDQNFKEELKTEEWKTESDVIKNIKKLGHDVQLLGIYEEIDLLYETVKNFEPDIVFNLTEHFGGRKSLDKAVVGLFEMMGVSYTGCGPAGLMLCRHKAMSKKLLTFHRIKNPPFTVIKQTSKKIKLPQRLKLPCIVKKANDDASEGISKASVVNTEEALIERVKFVHDKLGDDALVERFVQGRELYVSIIGNERLQVLPIREMKFGKQENDEFILATYRMKWDAAYRKKWGIDTDFVDDIEPSLLNKIYKVCKRVYRILKIDGYGRIDLRLTPHNEIIVIEANPNPHLAEYEDFALSAYEAGYEFKDLMHKIINLGIRRPASI